MKKETKNEMRGGFGGVPQENSTESTYELVMDHIEEYAWSIRDKLNKVVSELEKSEKGEYIYELAGRVEWNKKMMRKAFKLLNFLRDKYFPRLSFEEIKRVEEAETELLEFEEKIEDIEKMIKVIINELNTVLQFYFLTKYRKDKEKTGNIDKYMKKLNQIREKIYEINDEVKE